MAYKYPYGNRDTVNLDWFINKFQELQTAWDNLQTEGVVEAAERAENAAVEASNAAEEATSAARAIEESSAQIATNAQNIATNAQGIATNAQNIATNAQGIATNAQNISNLENELENLDSSEVTDNSDIGGATVEASLNSLKGSLNTLQNTFSHVGGAQSNVTCAPTVSTALASLSLSAGTWIVCGVHEWTTSIDALYSDFLMDATSNTQLARSQNLSQRNGGGITITVIVTLTTASTIRYMTYNGGSAENTTRRIHFDAIRIL